MSYLGPVFSLNFQTRPSRQTARRELEPLCHSYPNGSDWLDRRLDDVENGRADYATLNWGQLSVAHALMTPKGRNRWKLCTFYLPDWARHRGIGRIFLRHLQRRWMLIGAEQVAVTVDVEAERTGQFFVMNDFHRLGGHVSYGSDRNDAVFVWTPSAAVGRYDFQIPVECAP